MSPRSKKAAAEFAKTRIRCIRASFPKGGGVYVWFVLGKAAFRPFKVADDGLIYIGLASDLTRRELMQHLRSDKTGGSSLRRSLGAILKKKLKLVAIPRSASKSDAKRFSHYRFTNDGEARLTKWMHDNLEVGFFECADYALVESDLIRDRKPLLCLTGWDNPDRKSIRALRKQCATEARRVAQQAVAADRDMASRARRTCVISLCTCAARHAAARRR